MNWHSNMLSDAERLRWYSLIVLTLVMTCCFVDRYALVVLIQPIRAEFHLTDTQIGLLTGFAFSAAYASMVLPIALYADKTRKRKNIICIALATWSVLTAICGACQSYWQLLVVRFFFGGAEAGNAPPAHSLLTEIFPLSARSTALGTFSAGAPGGLLLAYALCGPIEAHVGWRWALVIIGLAPGLILTLLVALTLKEPSPKQGATPHLAHGAASKGSLKDLLANPTMIYFLIAAIGATFLAFGQTLWIPIFIERSFHIPRAQLGLALALTQAFAMVVGMVAGGPIADWLFKRRGISSPRFVSWCVAAAIVPLAGMYLSPAVNAVYICSAWAAFPLGMLGGPVGSICQAIAHPSQRATAAALNALTLSIVGVGVAPFIVGALSDALAPRFHDDSLRWALLCIVGIVVPMTLYCLSKVQRVWSTILTKGAELASSDSAAALVGDGTPASAKH
jgi:MFS family permease